MRPDDPVLSEESADDPIRLASRRVWIVDPLDGTREFAEGREDWAVHIALAIDGAPRPAPLHRQCDVHIPIPAAFPALTGLLHHVPHTAAPGTQPPCTLCGRPPLPSHVCLTVRPPSPHPPLHAPTPAP
ncbi:inositol monophosphatase family protein, partial [Sphingomonas koreensis]|uniref:inositol monophosphatase family protein n=1 Tax=Sphingomonas koreensis TaxID=93064 RepID=UPI0030C667AB